MEFPLFLFSVITFPQIDPVLIRIGPLAIHWYGIAYVVGILLGWRYARALVSNDRLWAGGKAPFSVEEIDDFLLWGAVGIVAGGRIGYILFYDLQSVIENPVRALQIWNGGMSFHGGFLGTTLAMIIFARMHKASVWSLFDIVSAVVPIGLFFGRIANFINGELWGKLSALPWAVVFPDAGPFARHPSQLYEAALEGIGLWLLCRLLTHVGLKLKKPGFVAGGFVAGYAISRILVEFVREPDAHIGYLLGGWLTMGMLLSLPMLAVGVWMMASAKPATSQPDAG